MSTRHPNRRTIAIVDNISSRRGLNNSSITYNNGINANANTNITTAITSNIVDVSNITNTSNDSIVNNHQIDAMLDSSILSKKDTNGNNISFGRIANCGENEMTRVSECIICYDKFTIKNNYFKCTRYHEICKLCFKKLFDDKFVNLKCPICKSDLRNEVKPLYLLSDDDIFNIDVEYILQKNVFVHQYFELNPSYKEVTVINKNKKLILYSSNGNLAMHEGMFISKDGFLYSYNNEHDRYQLAIKKTKFQFWDNSRIVRM